MTGGKILDWFEIDLRSDSGEVLTLYVDIFDSNLSRKWLDAVNHLLKNNYHLEKNYCFFGFVNSRRNGEYILNQVNACINEINQSQIGYQIDDFFSLDNCLSDDFADDRYDEINIGRNIIHSKFNKLHHYFEDLQGVSGNLSPYYLKASPNIRWNIRQLNLLCHEFESWALSYRKQIEAPEWQRLTQLMCWLNAPRFTLDENDYDLFGIETINRSTGGVFVGVNKAVGKHHWEVFNDEGRDSRIVELTTSVLRSQTEAAGDFDIEWGQNPATFNWQQVRLQQFREWLINNGFDPNDKHLTIGHPQVGQVNLEKSFQTVDLLSIWKQLDNHLDVYEVRTSSEKAQFDYRWDDADFVERQIQILKG